jgi:hypothetical protein
MEHERHYPLGIQARDCSLVLLGEDLVLHRAAVGPRVIEGLLRNALPFNFMLRSQSGPKNCAEGRLPPSGVVHLVVVNRLDVSSAEVQAYGKIKFSAGARIEGIHALYGLAAVAPSQANDGTVDAEVFRVAQDQARCRVCLDCNAVQRRLRRAPGNEVVDEIVTEARGPIGPAQLVQSIATLLDGNPRLSSESHRALDQRSAGEFAAEADLELNCSPRVGALNLHVG